MKIVIWSLLECYKIPYEVPERFRLDLFWNRVLGEMELAWNLIEDTDEQFTTCHISDKGEPDMSNDDYISN